MSRHDDQRLADILASAEAITAHTQRGGLDDGLIYDAVRIRLIKIGEAVKSIDPALLAHEPDIPWVDIAGMRNYLRPELLELCLVDGYSDSAHICTARRGAHERST
jgi:uncharacterized protein with HEPN domain